MIKINENEEFNFDEVKEFLLREGYYYDKRHVYFERKYKIPKTNWNYQVIGGHKISWIKISHRVTFHSTLSILETKVQFYVARDGLEPISSFLESGDELYDKAVELEKMLSRKFKLAGHDRWVGDLGLNTRISEKYINDYCYKIAKELPKLMPKISSILRTSPIKQKGRV